MGETKTLPVLPCFYEDSKEHFHGETMDVNKSVMHGVKGKGVSVILVGFGRDP